jgi:4-amino-4-deoxy-L-arabinose transferase-like glycosyltransferase
MRSLQLYIFILLIFSLTVIIRVLPIGFHPDSLVYMSIANNLIHGNSSFWNLHFTDLIFDHFYEHPPLGIYIMSLFFSAFGDTLYVDKFFGSFFGIVISLEIALIYRLLFPKKSKNGILLAIFYFLSFPLVPYTLESNLLEIPAAFFVLLSVYLFLKNTQTTNKSLLYSFLFSLTLLGAFLTKGPVTLFPLALPFFYFVLFSSEYPFIRAIKFSFFTAIFIGLFVALFYNYTPSHYYFTQYFQHQILSSLDGSRGGDDHFKLVLQILTDLFWIFFGSLLLLFISNKKFIKPLPSKTFLLFILIGLSASLPLEISPRQSDYYLFLSYPFFAIAFAILFVEHFTATLKKFAYYKLFKILNIILLIIFSITAWYKIYDYRHHKKFYKDFVEAKVALPKGAHIRVCASNPADQEMFFKNTEIPGELKRNYDVELVNNSAPYLLSTLASFKRCPVDSAKYQYIGPPSPEYFLLYRQIEPK